MQNNEYSKGYLTLNLMYRLIDMCIHFDCDQIID